MKDALLTALAGATAALRDDDAAAAAAALQQAAAACTEAQRRGLRLERSDVAALLDVHGRCLAAARGARATLDRALGTAGAARRAADAYRR